MTNPPGPPPPRAGPPPPPPLLSARHQNQTFMWRHFGKTDKSVCLSTSTSRPDLAL